MMSNKNNYFSKSNRKPLLIISLCIILSLIITQIKTQNENIEKDPFKKTHHNLKIESKEDLKKFVQVLLSEELPKNYTQLTRAEQLFYDSFINRMVESYNYTNFTPDNIKKHLTPENIETQKNLAFEDFTFDYHLIEDDLKKQIKDNEPTPDDFYDDDLGKDDEKNEDDKVNETTFDGDKGKNEL